MKKVCATCKHDGVEPSNEPCILCRYGSDGIPTEWEGTKHYKPQTNADRIRAMSDEELAHWICKRMNSCSSETCPGAELCNATDGLSNGLVKWLQQPAEVDNG